jgi:hypothetical protein
MDTPKPPFWYGVRKRPNGDQSYVLWDRERNRDLGPNEVRLFDLTEVKTSYHFVYRIKSQLRSLREDEHAWVKRLHEGLIKEQKNDRFESKMEYESRASDDPDPNDPDPNYREDGRGDSPWDIEYRREDI